MGQSNFTSVGFFHFGTDHQNPITALKSAIDEFKGSGGTLNDALIVLPEGFNLGRRYDDDSTANFETAIVGDLERLSEGEGCTFVAGLIIADTPGIYPPYNSAYLIDGHQHIQLLARKTTGDHTVSPYPYWKHYNYTPHESFKSEVMSYRGVVVAALVCVDGLDSARHNPEFLKTFQNIETTHRVLCIPASTGEYFGPEYTSGSKVTQRGGKQAIIVIANSHRTHPSFVSDLSGVIVSLDAKGPLNCIQTVPLEALRG
jgi:predicted amidohydrolase